MLRVDIRELARRPVETRGQLAPDDPALADTGFVFGQPVEVEGRLQGIDDSRFYWNGSIRTVVRGECRRCLNPVETPVAVQIGALFTKDPDALDDPDSYPVAPDATDVDVTPAIREELLLAVPQFAVCRDDCRGLCPQCGKDLNAGSCGCSPQVDTRWQPLRALKDKLRSN